MGYIIISVQTTFIFWSSQYVKILPFKHPQEKLYFLSGPWQQILVIYICLFLCFDGKLWEVYPYLLNCVYHSMVPVYFN